MNQQTPPSLAQLRDIVVPNFEPETPWLGINLVVLAVLLPLALLRFAQRRRYPWRQTALEELDNIKQLPPDQAHFQLNRFLRRLMLALNPESAPKNASGERWVSLLNHSLRTDFFSTREGNETLAYLYQAHPPDLPESNIETIKQLLRRRTRFPW